MNLKKLSAFLILGGLISVVALAQETKYQELYSQDNLSARALRDSRAKFQAQYLRLKSKQEFSIIEPDSKERISLLEFPANGPFYTYSLETFLPKKFLLRASYGFSDIDKGNQNGTDTDWIPWIIDYREWLQSKFDCQAKLKEYSFSLGYRMFDLGNRGFKRDLGEFYNVDSLVFDLFLGYLNHRGEYKMTNANWNIINWQLIDPTPIDGLNSYYNVTYLGPFVSARVAGSFKKWFSSELALSYAIINTHAHAYWNLRDYNFSQRGKTGSFVGLDWSISVYPADFLAITPGFHYGCYYQDKLKESGTQPGYTYEDEKIVTDVTIPMSGVSLAITASW